MLSKLLIPGFAMTGREVARLCGISHTMAIKILKEFEALNLAKNRLAGRSVVEREYKKLRIQDYQSNKRA